MRVNVPSLVVCLSLGVKIVRVKFEVFGWSLLVFLLWEKVREEPEKVLDFGEKMVRVGNVLQDSWSIQLLCGSKVNLVLRWVRLGEKILRLIV